MDKIFSLKVSESEKYANDCQWFKDYRTRFVPVNLGESPDYTRMLQNYQIINNDISSFTSKLRSYCDVYLGGSELNSNELDELMPYNRLYMKLGTLVGEFIGLLDRSQDYRVVLMSRSAIQAKDELFKKKMLESIQESVRMGLETAEMSQSEAETHKKNNMVQPTPADLMDKTFKTGWELFYEHALNLCYYIDDIKNKATELWMDCIIANRCAVKVGTMNGMPTVKVLNPLRFGMNKSRDVQYGHKGDMSYYREALTLTEVIDRFDLTPEEYRNIHTGRYTNYHSSNVRNDVLGGRAGFIEDNRALEEWTNFTDRNSYRNKEVGLHQTNGLGTKNRGQDLIWVTHVEFKAYTKVYFRSYLNEYNKKVVELFTTEYEIPSHATSSMIMNHYGKKYKTYFWYDEEAELEYELEVHWLPRRHEFSLIGDSLYKDCREVPMQPVSINRPYDSFTLSYKSMVLDDRNADSVSLVERTFPLMFQYFFVKIIQNRELAKFRSYVQSVDVDQIPKKLGMDADNNVIQDEVPVWLNALRQLNIDFYSGTQNTTGGLGLNTRSPGSSVTKLGSAQEIIYLQQLLDLIDKEISFSMGISPQREAHFESNTNVRDNANAITQSTNMTRLTFFRMFNFLKEIFKEWLDQYVIYVRTILESGVDNHFIHYVTPSGTDVLFEVTEEHLGHNDIGLWITDSSQEDLYSRTMLNLVQAFAQNAGEGVESVSKLVRLISSSAPSSEIHEAIVKETNKRKKEMQEAQENESRHQEKLLQEQLKAREDVQAHEIEKIVIKELERRETELEKAKITSTVYAQGQDINNNNVPDRLEIEKFKHNQEVALKKLDLENRKANDNARLKEKELNIKRNARK